MSTAASTRHTCTLDLPLYSSALASPTYTPSAPTPDYSPTPHPDEHRLDFQPAQHRRAAGNATFTRRGRGFVLVLQGLYDERDDLPEYGRHAIVRGQITLDDGLREHVRRVDVKLEGRLALTIAEGGTVVHNVLSSKHTVWSATSGQACPRTLPVMCAFPTTYKDGQRNRPLPAAYNVSFPGVPGLHVASQYTLSVVVKQKRKIAPWTQQKCVSTPLNYYPRTRPHRPILPPNLSFFDTIKTAPEEWYEVVTAMKTRASSGLQPIDCHLYVPSVQIYAIGDTIPFHLQLSAPAASLLAFLPSPSTSLSRRPSFTIPLLSAGTPPPKPKLRVFLMRQVSVEVRGQKEWRNSVLGEGTMRQLPSAAECTLDWEGEVRCREDVSVGGFNCGCVVVRDFIMLCMKPPIPETSPLVELQHAHPIRLVTDSWADMETPLESEFQ